MAKNNSPATGTKPAQAPPPPPASAGAPPEPEKPKRTRNKLSPQKQFAIMIAGLVTILNRKGVTEALTDADRAQVASAQAAAKEINDSTITPVLNRIEAIKTELAEIGAKLSKPDADFAKLATEISDLKKELERKQKQLNELQAPATV